MNDRAKRALVLVVAASVALWLPAALAAGEAPSIAGSYKLTKRVLPDGKEMKGPDVVGFLTYTENERNFNVMWKNPDGTKTSLSYVAEYKLSPTEYCETPVYWMQNNLGAAGVKYGAPPEKSECSAVTVKGKELSFAIKGEPPVVTFTPTGLIAKAEGQFTDHWEKVQ